MVVFSGTGRLFFEKLLFPIGLKENTSFWSLTRKRSPRSFIGVARIIAPVEDGIVYSLPDCVLITFEEVTTKISSLRVAKSIIVPLTEVRVWSTKSFFFPSELSRTGVSSGDDEASFGVDCFDAMKYTDVTHKRAMRHKEASTPLFIGVERD